MSGTESIEATVAIIGSGVAGALTACRLAKAGVKQIVILEAGPRVDRDEAVTKFRHALVRDNVVGFPNPDWAPRPDWTNEKNPYIELTGPVSFKGGYLRVVGGTTWHWGGCTPRLRPADFLLSSLYGVGKDWPLDYAALESFYTEAEYEMGVAGETDDGSWRSKPFPLPPVPLSYANRLIAEGLKKLGVPLTSRPAARATLPYRTRGQCQGFGTCSPICPSGAQYAAIEHIEEAEKLGVRVLENTRVDKIFANEFATRLEARKPDGTVVGVGAKIFVLAANAIETPRLLLMSANETHPGGLANSSLQVGRNFMEHPTLDCRMIMPKSVYPGRGPESIAISSVFRDGTFRRKRPAMQLSVESGVAFEAITYDALARSKEPRELDAAIKDRATREIELHFNVEQLPDQKNAITIDWTRKDRAGQPGIRQYYSLGAYEKAGLAFAHETFGRFEAALGAKISFRGEPEPDSHPMGTTRMGADPKSAVTDSFGRCHDHKNLFIVSSSLFPSGGCVNPTLTIAALALRTGDEIARQLEGSGQNL